MHKEANGMSETFKLRVHSHYNLRHNSQFAVNPVHIVFISWSQHRIWKNWQQVTSKIKSLKSLKVQEKIKWKHVKCPNRTCKVFIPN